MIDVNDVDLRCMCDYFLYLIVFACFRLHSSLILLNIALIMASRILDASFSSCR